MTAGRGIVHSERTDRRVAQAPAAPAGHPDLGGAAAAPRGDRARLRPPSRRRAAAHRRRGQVGARGGRHALRRELAGGDSLRALLRRCHSDPRRVAPAGRRARRARRLPARRRDRDRRSRLRPRPPPGLRARSPAHHPRLPPPRVCCSSVASRSTARATSGGTSSRAARIASSRPRRTGSRAASPRSPARRNSFRCRTRLDRTTHPHPDPLPLRGRRDSVVAFAR